MLDSFAAQLIKAVLVFVGVLALVYLVSGYMNRYWRSMGRSGNLQLLGGLQVGPKARVVLLRALDQVYVLGVAEQQVTVIDMVDEEALPEAGASTRPLEPGGFVRQLRNQLMRRDRGGTES